MTFNKAEPLYLSIHDIKEGQERKETLRITHEMVRSFASLIQDNAPIHANPIHALEMNFDKPIVHGFLVSAGYSGILGMYLPGCNTIIQKISIEMRSPVYISDLITYKVEVSRVIPAVHSVCLDLSATNQENLLVNKGSATCVFRN